MIFQRKCCLILLLILRIIVQKRVIIYMNQTIPILQKDAIKIILLTILSNEQQIELYLK